MSTRCKVCINEIPFGKPDICEACRSFYKRNRKRNDLICRTGRNRCFIDEGNGAKVSKAGSVWRDLCPACRMKKWHKVKQENEENRTIVQDKPDNHTIIVPSKVDKEVANTVGAALELVSSMKYLSTRNRQLNFGNSQEPLAIYLNSIKEQICHMKTYATRFSGFRNLSVKDRTLVFMTTQFRVLAGEGCIYNDDFYIASTSSSSFKRVTAIVSGLDDVYERGFQLWKFIQSINFNQAEIGFYLAFLFFNALGISENVAFMSLSGRNEMVKTLEELENAYTVYMAGEYKDLKSKQQRINLMNMAVRLTSQESLYRFLTCKVHMSRSSSFADKPGAQYFKVLNSKPNDFTKQV